MSSKAIRAIGFDLGETLITYRSAPLNWVSLYRPALVGVAKVLGQSPSETAFLAAESVLKRYNTRLNPRTVEVKAEQIFSEALAEFPGKISKDDNERAVRAFFGFFRQSLCAYPETISVLRAVRERGVKVGALTDVPYGMPREFVEADLRETEVDTLIDVWLTSVDVGVRKPAPEGFVQLTKSLGVELDEMIYVGNEPKDIQGPRAAGIRSVLVSRESEPPPLGQDASIASLESLLKLLG